MEAIRRGAGVPADWAVRPWLFVPRVGIKPLVATLPPLSVVPKITPVEMTEPWRYCGWDRQGEAAKPDIIPPEMQAQNNCRHRHNGGGSAVTGWYS